MPVVFERIMTSVVSGLKTGVRVIPAQAGIQCRNLDTRLRGNDKTQKARCDELPARSAQQSGSEARTPNLTDLIKSSAACSPDSSSSVMNVRL